MGFDLWRSYLSGFRFALEHPAQGLRQLLIMGQSNPVMETTILNQDVSQELTVPLAEKGNIHYAA